MAIADAVSELRPDPDFQLAELACRRILVRLSLLHDAPTATIRTEGQAAHPTLPTRLRTHDGPWHEEGASGRGDPLPVKGERSFTGSIPAGVRVDGGHEAVPSKQFSLWAHYSYRIDRARAQVDPSDPESTSRAASTLLRLAACATRDYEVYIGRRPAYHENHEAAVTELLRDCVGVPAVEASWYLGAPLKWIKQQRVLHRRDPETGDVLFRRDDRTQRIFALNEEGMKHGEIAEAVGLTRQRVQQILSGK